jgi:ABC-type bacteriocin/lantibiotic exporter with double-glycine peptidase domain
MTQANTQPITGDEAGNVYARFNESRPILEMLEVLAKTGRKNFSDPGVWEICLCALILRIQPGCKVQRILECLPHHSHAMDEADVLNFMANMGYFCRPAESELYDIDDRLLPGLFIPTQGNPCVVLGRDRDDTLQFYDPLSKLVSTVPPTFDRLGKVWFFQIYDENRPPISRFMRKGTGYSWFRALLTRFKGTFMQVMLAGLVLNIIALTTPIFIMLVYDRVIAADSPATLPMLTLGVVLSIIFEVRLRAVRTQGLSWLAGRLDNIVGNRIFAHLIGLSPALIEKASVSAQIARIKTFESVRDFFSGSMFLSLLEIPFVVISAAAIAVIAGPLVFVPLAMVLAYLLLFAVVRRYVKVSIRLAAKSSSARQQFTIETFEKLSGIRAHGLGDKWQEKFRNLSGREMLSHFHLSWLGMIAETMAHALTIMAAVATVGFGVHFIWQGQMTTGALVATMILVWRVLTPFYSLCTMIPRLEQLRNSIHQVNELMDIETEAEEAKSYSRLSQIRGAISFANASYRPTPESDPVFSGLSLEVRPGDLVMLTGSNGSGKADILKMIKALEQPYEGAVYIDGFDIRQLDAPNLRHQIAYVPRASNFFQGSVLENLRLSNPLASEEEIRSALDLADALEDVMRLPEGLETIIGSYGNDKLTSSLATRLSLARAYLHPASILLIDELPNTILASKAGKNLKNYLIRAKGKLTVLMVTYREDYMRIADTIVWLRGSAAPVVGPRDEVIATITGQGGLAA